MASARWPATKSGSTAGSSTGMTDSLARRNGAVRSRMKANTKISKTSRMIRMVIRSMAIPFLRWSSFHFDIDSFVDFTLTLIIDHADAPNLTGVGHMRAAVGLQIQPHQFDGANLLNFRRQEIDLGADQIRN